MKARYSARWVGEILPSVAVTLLIAALPAHAEFISFEQNVSIGDGTLFYNGAGGPLVGTDIAFDFVQGIGTPNLGTLVCGTTDGLFVTLNPCLLKFETGNLTSDTGDELTWAGNAVFGSFELVGGLVDTFTLTQISADGSTLLSGQITTASLEDAGFGQWEAGLGGLDIKDADLVEFFYGGGGPDDFRYVNSELVISGIVDPSNGFDTAVDQADVVNSRLVVPEPGSALLLLLGLGSLAAYRRRS